jgi:hypothetical protein
MTMDPGKNQTLYEKKTPGLGRYGLAANCAPGHECVLFRSVDGKRDRGKVTGSSLSWHAPHIECSSSDAVVGGRQRICFITADIRPPAFLCRGSGTSGSKASRETEPMQPEVYGGEA